MSDLIGAGFLGISAGAGFAGAVFRKMYGGPAPSVDGVSFPPRSKPATRLFASGTVLVTGSGELIIDEVLPAIKTILENPDIYIVIEFDPNAPAPPPCAGGLPDECDWTLCFKHVHDDTHIDPKQRHEELKLKIEWRVAAARFLTWRIYFPV